MEKSFNCTSGSAPIQKLLLRGVRIGKELREVGDRLLQELDLIHVLVAHASKLVGGGHNISMVCAVGIWAVAAPSPACNIGHRPGKQMVF